MVEAFIGLGSNLAQPESQLSSALSALSKLENSNLLSYSSLYLSKPMGPKDQPNYVNGVACLRTSLSPLVLLAALQNIEQHQGRERKEQRWGPRTLDLDILLYGQESIQLPELTIPHYGMKEREFVLYPLYEICPDLLLPGDVALRELLDNCPLNDLQKLTTSLEIQAKTI